MFTVRCPLTFLWHPNVHHSLALLRLLRKKHTLEIQPPGSSHGSAFTTSLSHVAQFVTVSDGTSDKSSGFPSTVYQPDHIFFLSEIPLESNPKVDMISYIGASAVSVQILNGAEALLVALEGRDVELIRKYHARLLSLIEKLEETLEDSHNPEELSKTSLSTAPLYATLQFLIKEGGLLLSAFPNVSVAYKRLISSTQDIKQHLLFVDRSLDNYYSRYGRGVDFEGHPLRGFLAGVHQTLSTYNTSFEESITKGVVGDGGALKSRVSGGRLGVQSISSTMPWTRKNLPLRSSA